MQTLPTKNWSIFIGGFRGYHGEPFSKDLLIREIQHFQTQHGIKCVNVIQCDYIAGDHVESGFRIELINYPRFPEDRFNNQWMSLLASTLLNKLEQNRLTLVGPEETILFENQNAEAHP